MHQARINLILTIILVLLFAFLAWLNENRFFAIFIVFFFVLASFFQKQRYFSLIIVPLLVFILFNTITMEALVMFKNSDLPTIQHPKAQLSTLFTPDSGLGVLPVKVLTMISLLKESQIESYRLSEKFANDVVIYQRIVEGAWPIKLENTSSYVLLAPDEEGLYNDCVTINKKEDVVLVNCN